MVFVAEFLSCPVLSCPVEIRKAFAEKDAQIEQLQARIAALESVCRRLIEIDDGVYELPDLAIKVLARSCREMLETRRK
jgi:hypothetical protein